MKILITGGSGFIGRHLIPHLLAHKHHITVLSRNPLRAFQRLGHQIQVIDSLTPLLNLDSFDAVINLAGEPIAAKRWSQRQKQRICNSRWQLTEHLAAKLQAGNNPPKVVLSGSAVGYYGDHQDQLITEQTLPQRDDFAYRICERWEQLAMTMSGQSRVCLLRTGLVLGMDGGVLKQLLPSFRLGAGSIIGNGQHFQPWIHIHDTVRALEYLLMHEQCAGPYNLSAPHPVRQRQFSKTLAAHLHRPCLLRLPAPVLRLGFAEMSELLLTSQRVMPQRLTQEENFSFMFNSLDDALENLLSHP